MSSGTINLTNSSQTSGGGYIMGCIDWTAETNTDANTSTVTANLFLKKAISGGTVSTLTNGTWECSLAVNGESVSSGVYKSIGGDWSLMLSKTVTVSHNADGSKTITLSGAGWGPSGTSYSGKAAEGSGSITLATIPRASSLSAGTLTLGWDTNSVTITAQASGFRHDVYLKVGSKSVCMLHDVLAGKHKITPTLTDFANQIVNSTSGTGTLTLYTYNAAWTAEVGRKSYTVTVNIPASVVPSISSMTIAEATSGLASKFGAYVQNKSKLSVSVSASGSYGSSISRYETTIGGTVYRDQSFTSNVLTSSGSINVVTKVTDSRGRTASVTKAISVLAYSAPKISTMTVSRINTDGDADEEGNRLALRLAYAIASLGEKNDHTLTVRCKKTGESYITVANETAAWSFNDTLKYTGAPDVSPDYSYVVQVTLADYFGATTVEAELHTSGSILDFLADGTGVAIGKAAENSEQLDVAWPILARQGIASESLKLSKALDVAYGGTGVTSSSALAQKIFGSNYEAWQSLGSYPTAPGIYRTVGTNIFKNLQSPHGNYGVLVILKAAYALHIYVDEYGRVFCGRSGDTFAEPTWYSIDSVVSEYDSSDGIWHVKQYADGWAECWGSKNYSGAASYSWGGLYALVCSSPDYPVTFTTYPNFQREIALDSSASCWLSAWNQPTKTNPGQFALTRPTNLSINATVKFYARGKWK